VLGLAVFVAVGQLNKLLGVSKGEGNTVEKLAHVVRELPQANGATVLVSLAALAALFGLPRLSRSIPADSSCSSGAASSALDLEGVHGVAVAGTLPKGLPRITWPDVPASTWLALVPSAVGIVLVAYSEALGVAREFADKHAYDVDADQELTAHGFANLVSGLLGGMVAAGSMSASAVKERAAVIVHALWHILVARKLQAVRTLSRTEFWLGVLTFAGVVIIDVLPGMVIGVLALLLLVIYRSSQPHLSILGRVPGVSGKYADLARHPEAVRVPGVLVIRFDAPIYYANALSVRGRIEEIVQAEDVPPRAIVLDASVQDALDVTSAEMLTKLVAKLQQAGIEIAAAEVHAPVLAFARTSGLLAALGPERVFPTVDAAVHGLARDPETPFSSAVPATAAPR
jgi:MFS superfamily sulfate permease-like transporter